jgi:predicted component of type VI protein secretion system
MAARLQHQLHDLAMPEGTFLIGRGADCHLALDDVLVSRRHAAIQVAADGSAVLEDLGSRNGVFLNGAKVEKSARLQDGDLIRIGSQDICFYHVSDSALHPASAPRAARVTMQAIPRADLEAALAAMDVEPPPPSSSAAPPSAPVSAPVSAPLSTPAPSSRGLPPTVPSPVIHEMRLFDPSDPDEATTISSSSLGVGGPGRLVTGLTIIGSVADKALALGRAEEAERILQRSLVDVQMRAAKGEVDAELAERAAGYAVRLATGTGRGSWIDYVFQLYTTLRWLLPGRLVDELYAGVRKVKATDKAVLRAYTSCLRQISGNFGPAERFVQQRIESLERWAP